MHQSIMRSMTIALGMVLALASCASDGVVSTEAVVPAGEVTVSEAHDCFVRAFLEGCPNREHLDREERVRRYVLAVREVCEERRFDYEPTIHEMNTFLSAADEWRRAGIWDIFDPAAHSPVDAVAGFVEAGVIPAEHEPQLRSLFEELRRATTDRGVSLAVPMGACAEVTAIAGLLDGSCSLWADLENDGPVPIPVEDEMTAKWWKDVLKYLGIGACDGLAGAAAFYLTAGNPFATGFFGALASVAAQDAFEERGW